MTETQFGQPRPIDTPLNVSQLKEQLAKCQRERLLVSSSSRSGSDNSGSSDPCIEEVQDDDDDYSDAAGSEADYFDDPRKDVIGSKQSGSTSTGNSSKKQSASMGGDSSPLMMNKSSDDDDHSKKRNSVAQKSANLMFDDSINSKLRSTNETGAFLAKSASLQRSVLTNRTSNRNQSKKQIKAVNSFSSMDPNSSPTKTPGVNPIKHSLNKRVQSISTANGAPDLQQSRLAVPRSPEKQPTKYLQKRPVAKLKVQSSSESNEIKGRANQLTLPRIQTQKDSRQQQPLQQRGTAQPAQTATAMNQSFQASVSHVRIRPSSTEIMQTQQKLLLENPAPYVSATQWAIIDRKKGDLLFGKCETEARQVASLTKIMTAYCVLNLVEKYECVGPYAQLTSNIKILRPISKINGTTANLLEGDTLSVNELMYGMMLPSGNDAATALGCHFGAILKHQGTKNPEIEISTEAVERRLRANKVVAARNYREEIERRHKKEESQSNFEQQQSSPESMTCKALFSNFSCNLRQTEGQRGHGLDVEEAVTPKQRPSAMKFLDRNDDQDSEDDLRYDSESEPRFSLNLRAHSPSPKRARGSLLDLFTTSDFNKMGETNLSCVNERPKKLSAREIDEKTEGEIANTPYNELPPTFNEMSERKRIYETLLNERIDNQLSYFYQEMNDTACKVGMKKSNFAVAHGMHHYSNYSSAMDIAKLSRVALAQQEYLQQVVNTKEFSVTSRVNRNFQYNWKNTNFMLWSNDANGTYTGIKTGVTPTAGPCLAVCYRSRCGTYDFVVTVLNCKTREARFIEIPKLIRWAINRITKVKQSNLRPGIKRRLLRNMAHV